MHSKGKAILPQEQMMARRGFVTPQAAADLVGRHLITLYSLMREGKVEAVHVGRRRYVRIESLRAYFGPILLGPVPKEKTP